MPGLRSILALSLLFGVLAAGDLGAETVARKSRAACAPDEVVLRGDFGQIRFAVEIADDDAERALGLMNRESMPRGAGMLFIYPRVGPVSFWMRNTLIPLDMIFIGEDGIVSRVHSRAVPLDETPIAGGDEVLAVLEINGGLAESYGIGEGTEVRHPAFGAQAAWPCKAAPQ